MNEYEVILKSLQATIGKETISVQIGESTETKSA